jgi:hypothetical protein
MLQFGRKCIETIINIWESESRCSLCPLDPDYPEERERYIMDNSGSMLHLTKLMYRIMICQFTKFKRERYDNIEDLLM